MKVFRELTIAGARELLARFSSELPHEARDGWKRDRQREAELLELGPYEGEGSLLCFACGVRSDRQAARLFLVREKGKYHVSNIVPSKIQELTMEQYNAILSNFYETMVKQLADRLKLRAVLSSDQKSIDTVLGRNLADKLRTFSRAANKSMLHPNDQKRWREFIVAAHKKGIDLNSGIPQFLERWLIDEEHWSEDAASTLISEYEFAEDVLRDYDCAS